MPFPGRKPLTRLAHEILQRHLGPGDLVIDATAGNGHDTLFLARAVSPVGEVFAFDVQRQALQQTRTRLEGEGMQDLVTLFHGGHETLAARVPERAHGRIAAVMFNLGYLPGSDKQITTASDTTLPALRQSATLLAAGGLLSVLAYRHHPGGQAESTAVAAFLGGLEGFRLEVHESPGPVLFVARKHG